MAVLEPGRREVVLFCCLQVCRRHARDGRGGGEENPAQTHDILAQIPAFDIRTEC